MSKGILGVGDSFMWGESLYFYSDLPNLPFVKEHSFDFDTMTEGFVGYKNKYRFIQLVADHYDTWCTVRALNGSTNESNLNFINQFNYTDVIEPTGRLNFNFKLDINEYSLFIFLFTSHLRDDTIISDVLESANTVFSKFEEKGCRVATLCWMPEFFDNDVYRQYYLNTDRHIPLVHGGVKYDSYEEMVMDDSLGLTIKSDFKVHGKQMNDIHFNKEGHRVMADSIIKFLDNKLFKI